MLTIPLSPFGSQEDGYADLVIDAGDCTVRYRDGGLYRTAFQFAAGQDVTRIASQAITEAGAIELAATYVDITGPESSTYAVTLAAPTVPGIVKVIEMTATTDTNAVTLALTNVVGGSEASSASFDAAGETLVLVSAGDKWVVLAEVGVTLS